MRRFSSYAGRSRTGLGLHCITPAQVAEAPRGPLPLYRAT
jgi:hypothetical protein